MRTVCRMRQIKSRTVVSWVVCAHTGQLTEVVASICLFQTVCFLDCWRGLMTFDLHIGVLSAQLGVGALMMLCLMNMWNGLSAKKCSDVTISKFRFLIDFDSIFSPKWRFRFDSILVTATLNHSRQNSVTTDAGRSSSKRFIAFTKPAGVC